MVVAWRDILKVDRFPRDKNAESFMLKHSVWKDEAGLDWEDGNPSIEQIEELVGRRLTKEDFKLYAPATWRSPNSKPTVMSRIGKEGIIEGIQHFQSDPMAVIEKIPPKFNPNAIRDGYKKFIRESLEQIGENPEDYLGEAE